MNNDTQGQDLQQVLRSFQTAATSLTVVELSRLACISDHGYLCQLLSILETDRIVRRCELSQENGATVIEYSLFSVTDQDTQKNADEGGESVYKDADQPSLDGASVDDADQHPKKTDSCSLGAVGALPGVAETAYPKIDRQEMREWVDKAQRGDRKARDLIVCSFLPRIQEIARRQCGHSDDLAQEAFFTLIKAINTFDFAKSNDFVAYAVMLIKFGMSDQQGKETAYVATVTLDEPRSADEDEPTRAEQVECREIDLPDVTIEHYEAHALIEDGLAALNEKERVVVELRHGLCGGGVVTLDFVGALLGVSRQRVHQIQTMAEAKLNDREALHIGGNPGRLEVAAAVSEAQPVERTNQANLPKLSSRNRHSLGPVSRILNAMLRYISNQHGKRCPVKVFLHLIVILAAKLMIKRVPNLDKDHSEEQLLAIAYWVLGRLLDDGMVIEESAGRVLALSERGAARMSQQAQPCPRSRRHKRKKKGREST